MHSPHLVERAFQLAPGVSSVEEIRKALRQEGYSNIDAHLAGASIRADLKKRLGRWAPDRNRRETVAKGQQRSTREARKPKKAKVKTIAANPSQKGGQRGLENLKN